MASTLELFVDESRLTAESSIIVLVDTTYLIYSFLRPSIFCKIWVFINNEINFSYKQSTLGTQIL